MTINEILNALNAPYTGPDPMTREEALAVLKQTRSYFLDAGRQIAALLCWRDGETHTRAVFHEMLLRGFPVDRLDGRWLGAVFSGHGFVATGRQFYPTDEDYRNTHGNTHAGGKQRGCMIWKLAPATR